MTDLWVSSGVSATAMLLCEAARRASARLLRGACWLYSSEAVSTFQLCCCTQELKSLGDSVRSDSSTSSTLTFVITSIHSSTFREATCNPGAASESVCRGTASVGAAALLVALQLGAAVAARNLAVSVWSSGSSDMHVQHQRFGFRCFDPLGGTSSEAAAVESACAFAVQAVAMHSHHSEERLRVPFFAAVITALVYAGGSISGAVFNPASALSIQFPCSGHTYLEYCFIYWSSPVLGMASCILLFERIIPFLSGKSTIEMGNSFAQKEKTT